MNEIISVMENSLALAGYEIVDIGEDYLIVHRSVQDSDGDFRLTVTQEVN